MKPDTPRRERQENSGALAPRVPPGVSIIAEVGSVHDGSYGNAVRLIEAAAACGADAVKFQTHLADAETLPDAPAPSYFQDEPRDAYFRRTAFDPDQWRGLRRACERNGVEFMSSPFSVEAVDFFEQGELEQGGLARYKIPSGEVTNLPLIERVARTGKPVLLSSGMNSWAELDAAVAILRRAKAPFTTLQCTSEYPCPPERVGLNVLADMKERYRCPVGLSDHTLSNYASFAAVVLGATVIEKHFTFSRRMYGSDARHSLEPAEFADLVQGIRTIGTILAHPVDKDDLSRFGAMKDTFEKSIVTARPIEKGATLTDGMLTTKKPGTGIPARRLREFYGRKARTDIPANRMLRDDDVD